MSLRIEIRQTAMRHQVWCLYSNTLLAGFIAGYVERSIWGKPASWYFGMNDSTQYILSPAELKEVRERAQAYVTTLNVRERLAA